MTGKKTADARIISAKVIVTIDIRQLIEDQLYRKLPDAGEITIENVDWDETADWLDNDLERMPVAVEVAVTE